MAISSTTRAVNRHKANRFPSSSGLDQATHDIDRSALCPTPRITLDQYVRLLGAIDTDGGVSCLDDLLSALPGIERPISAILDLCDAGILQIDRDAVFDGNTRVWRLNS